MSSPARHQDGPLRALKALARFDAAKVAVRLAEATRQRTTTQQEVVESTQRCEEAAAELRVVASRAPWSPALSGCLQRIYRTERLGLEELNQHLAVAQRAEDKMRNELANLRNRELSLEKALLAQKRLRQLERQSREAALLDDMWLQQAEGVRKEYLANGDPLRAGPVKPGPWREL